MNKKILLSICIFLSLILNWSCAKSSNTVQPQNNPIVKQSPTSVDTIQKEVKPLIDFSPLVNKSVAEIEKIYGKPLLIDKKIVQSKDGEFRHYKVFKGAKNDLIDLQVDYFKGKAAGFYTDIPKELQTKSLEETIKLCGFKIEPKDAEIGQKGGDFWWNNSPSVLPFYSVHIQKFTDSGLFYHCEAQVKIQ